MPADIHGMLRYLCLIAILSLPTVVTAAPEGVVRVIDGDTIEIAGQRVRLHAIDAPESNQTCEDTSGSIWDCGAWVTREARALFEGKLAKCTERDVDRYGRIVATCRIDGIDMGATLVTSGLAFAYRRYGLEYDLAEKGAAVAGRGLHATEIQSPAAFRAAAREPQRTVHTRDAQSHKTIRVPETQDNGWTIERLFSWLPASLNPGCKIKGNVSRASGARIYHVPGQAYYAETRIATEYGERWFCSEADARAAGWRKARK